MPTLRQGAGKSAGTGAGPIGTRCSKKTTGTGQESADGREEVALHFDRLYFCGYLFVSICDTVFCRRSFSTTKRSSRTDSASDMVWFRTDSFAASAYRTRGDTKARCRAAGTEESHRGWDIPVAVGKCFSLYGCCGYIGCLY